MDPTVVAAWIAAGVSVLTFIGTLVAQYLGYRASSRDAAKTAEDQRKQLDRTLAEQSQQLDKTLGEQRIRTLNERFATAADRLGRDKPPEVRLAGVYAMAGLADDWAENRQTCVDVLCAYLRMPYENEPDRAASEPQRLAFQANREVRHTVIRIITLRLRDGAAVSWQGLNFDFEGVVFDGGDFRGVRFSGGTVHFINAQFSGGGVDFGSVRFSGGTVHFNHAQFSGSKVWFDSAQFSDGEVDFGGAEFSGSAVYFSGAQFSGGEVSFGSAKFSGGTVDLSGAQFSGGEVNISSALFCGGKVDFAGAEFSSGEVSFAAAEFSGGTVSFRNARFTGTEVDFRAAKFSGGEVSFLNDRFGQSDYDEYARFTGGEINFSWAVDWSTPPRFPWRNRPPSCVKLPGKEDEPKA
jgi:uncharacterized protein YjbI with pentapeptide repeats